MGVIGLYRTAQSDGLGFLNAPLFGELAGKAGYWMWAASFLGVALGLWMPAREPTLVVHVSSGGDQVSRIELSLPISTA